MKHTAKIIGIAIMAIIILPMAECDANNTATGDDGTAENKVAAEDKATAENKVVAEDYDYAKVANGDFSEFAEGYWIDTQTGTIFQLRADGTFSDGEEASSAQRRDDGVYMWGIGYGEGIGGYIAALFPMGVAMYMGVPSDTTKARIIMGQDFGPESPVYYYSPSAPAYYATTNVRLRSEPDINKDNRIATITEGDRVEVLAVGNADYIDEISARWYKVKTADGTIGWVFSGYLETRK